MKYVFSRSPGEGNDGVIGAGREQENSIDILNPIGESPSVFVVLQGIAIESAAPVLPGLVTDALIFWMEEVTAIRHSNNLNTIIIYIQKSMSARHYYTIYKSTGKYKRW